jgi:hypothetical protein
VLNADIPNMREWMAEQSYNFAAPIDYDKFINFANYFWVGKALNNKPSLSWNPDLNPEFYVIERPSNTDLHKMPVDLATTSNIALYANNRPPEIFTIKFTSNTTFVVTSNRGPVIASTGILNNTDEGGQTFVEMSANDSVSGQGDPDSIADKLCSFYITNGSAPFAAGDRIVINITYFTSQIYINLISVDVLGKGSVSGVNTTSPMMYIDGVQLTGGERILVKNQTDASENGIYRVSIGTKWQRTIDAETDDSLVVGSTIFVDGGISNSGKTFALTSKVPAVSTDGSLHSLLTFTDMGVQPKQVNDWQEFNFWYHRDDLQELISSGYITDAVIQASCPIIEYDNDVQMNKFIDASGNPAESGLQLSQYKTRFNQLPQFDLFRYDGTHFHC